MESYNNITFLCVSSSIISKLPRALHAFYVYPSMQIMENVLEICDIVNENCKL